MLFYETGQKRMATEESTVQRQVMLAASDAGYTIWRNNVGKAWYASSARQVPGGVILTGNPRMVRYGLAKGSSDLIGLRRVTISADMIGTTIAQFVAIECKSLTGKPTPNQTKFLSLVDASGGLAVLARSPEDVPRDPPS